MKFDVLEIDEDNILLETLLKKYNYTFSRETFYKKYYFFDSPVAHIWNDRQVYIYRKNVIAEDVENMLEIFEYLKQKGKLEKDYSVKFSNPSRFYW